MKFDITTNEINIDRFNRILREWKRIFPENEKPIMYVGNDTLDWFRIHDVPVKEMCWVYIDDLDFGEIELR